MGLSLQKGGNVSLNKLEADLKRILVGLGWDARSTDGQDFDLDASAFLLSDSGRVRSDADFIFYNQTRTPEGSVEHTGDNKTGAGDGDDEAIRIELGKVPAGVQKIAFCVTIHEADARRQNFGQVQSAFIRIVNDENQRELARFDLSEDASVETAMIFGEIYRHGGDWKFRAVGQGFAGGLGALARSFGVNI
jgi:tellurium resistance protein TerD